MIVTPSRTNATGPASPRQAPLRSGRQHARLLQVPDVDRTPIALGFIRDPLVTWADLRVIRLEAAFTG